MDQDFTTERAVKSGRKNSCKVSATKKAEIRQQGVVYAMIEVADKQEHIHAQNVEVRKPTSGRSVQQTGPSGIVVDAWGTLVNAATRWTSRN
ncbi:hypothetical protein PR048_033508 [Dryococelus australis]|uniref:Uncharacterized protein n=1 Tax=Dryococelus australis TaxID=614101 RepID=A0ABQ9G0G9_9NEOP|nr:hypothetical protein PR048_033508 [Dryococelus australis]